MAGRTEDGRFTTSVTDDDLIHFFETGERPFYGAGEIAEHFELSRSQAHRRLTELEESNELRRIDLGKRNVAWWCPRDIIVLTESEQGYVGHDLEVGVSSQGEDRADALRNLAEAIEVHQGGGDMSPDEIYEELDIDPDEVPEDAAPPF